MILAAVIGAAVVCCLLPNGLMKGGGRRCLGLAAATCPTKPSPASWQGPYARLLTVTNTDTTIQLTDIGGQLMARHVANSCGTKHFVFIRLGRT
jgi:hypothetical protein